MRAPYLTPYLADFKKEIKLCIKCKIHKPLNEFGTLKRNSDGKRGRCKDCEIQDRKEYVLKHPEVIERDRESSKKWYWANRERSQKKCREWSAKNKDRRYASARKNSLRNRYGITVENYNDLLIKQNHQCKICKTTNPGNGAKNFYVDHCHRSGVIRGLLCTHCNLAIGQFADDVTRIRIAADYVEKDGKI